MGIEDIEDFLVEGEHVVWNGRPSLVPFVLNTYPLFLLGLVLLAVVTIFFISPLFFNPAAAGELLPVWIILLAPWVVISAFFILFPVFAVVFHKTQKYVLTNKRIIKLGGGLPGYREFIPISQIHRVGINYGFFDRLFHVANISVGTQNQSSHTRKYNKYFYSIVDYFEFMSAVKPLIKDDQLYAEENWKR